MRILHTAMITGVVWYLMLPPPADGIPGRRLTFEPLSEWTTVDQFDSEQKCEDMRHAVIAQDPHSALDTLRCWPSDAPELKPAQPEPRPG